MKTPTCIQIASKKLGGASTTVDGDSTVILYDAENQVIAGTTVDTLLRILGAMPEATYPPMTVEDAPSDKSLRERLDEAQEQHGMELRRRQDAIRYLLIARTKRNIDGAGCDSGDPLDLTLAELEQACSHFADALAEQQGQTRLVTEHRDALVRRVAELEDALRKIEAWTFPATGLFYDEPANTQPVSYGAAYGSNGQRDYMRDIAANALAPKPEGV